MNTTWDSSFEAAPADTDEIKYGAGKIRELKAAINERAIVEHDWRATGKHLPGKTSCLYTGTTTEINALTGMSEGAIAYDETLGKLKMYTASAWTALALGAFPAGTKMLFYQDTAPTGWTIQNTLNDKLVFITKGSVAGGQTGGAVHSTGSWTITGFGGSVDGHALTIAELAPHNHTTDAAGNVGPHGEYTPYAAGYVAGSVTGTTGSGAAHVHTISSALTQNGAWRPAAYNCIICAKD